MSTPGLRASSHSWTLLNLLSCCSHLGFWAHVTIWAPEPHGGLSPNYSRGSRMTSRFTQAALSLCCSGTLVPPQAPPSPFYPFPSLLPTPHTCFGWRPSCRAVQPCWQEMCWLESCLEGNVADHISSARAKYYSDTAFQTDTNCSSNKHRRANPKTFIRVGKDERKGRHTRGL